MRTVNNDMMLRFSKVRRIISHHITSPQRRTDRTANDNSTLGALRCGENSRVDEQSPYSSRAAVLPVKNIETHVVIYAEVNAPGCADQIRFLLLELSAFVFLRKNSDEALPLITILKVCSRNAINREGRQLGVEYEDAPAGLTNNNV